MENTSRDSSKNYFHSVEQEFWKEDAAETGITVREVSDGLVLQFPQGQTDGGWYVPYYYGDCIVVLLFSEQHWIGGGEKYFTGFPKSVR